jgi:hypothetical protein
MCIHIHIHIFTYISICMYMHKLSMPDICEYRKELLIINAFKTHVNTSLLDLANISRNINPFVVLDIIL